MNRIRALREERNITINELAIAIGTYPKAISRWEKELNEISATNIKKLASFFEVSTDDLLGQEPIDYSKQRRGITPLENKLLSAFRKLSADDQNKIVGMVQAVAVMS